METGSKFHSLRARYLQPVLVVQTADAVRPLPSPSSPGTLPPPGHAGDLQTQPAHNQPTWARKRDYDYVQAQRDSNNNARIKEVNAIKSYKIVFFEVISFVI